MLQARLKTEAVPKTTSQSSQDLIGVEDKTFSSLASVDERLTRVEEMLRAQADRLRANQVNQFGSLYNISGAARGQSSPSGDSGSSESEGLEWSWIRVPPFVICLSSCSCACLLELYFRSFAFLDRVLGKLFVDCAFPPVLSPKCTIKSCPKFRARQLYMEYGLPMGFPGSTIVRMQFDYQRHFRPILGLGPHEESTRHSTKHCIHTEWEY